MRKGIDKLGQLQKKKEEYLERGLNHYLPMILGPDGGSKIRSHLVIASSTAVADCSVTVSGNEARHILI